ncbi:NAD(P)-binding domain-containing protein [Nocardia sp. NPDC003693]
MRIALDPYRGSWRRPGTLFVGCSTIDVGDAPAAAQLTAAVGHRALDAPVSGGVAAGKPAERHLGGVVVRQPCGRVGIVAPPASTRHGRRDHPPSRPVPRTSVHEASVPQRR